MAILQYFCDNCQNILKGIDSDIDFSASIEVCPFCGTFLSDVLQKRQIDLPVKSFTRLFKKASHLPKLTLDISKIDKEFHFLSLNNRVCIRGIHTQKLIERICVRAQLPSRYGGLDSKVLLVDGSNSSDIYQCVEFAQQYGLNVIDTLDGIISSRAFTVYQLTNIIIHELSSTIKQYDVKVVIITNLLYYFTNNPYLDTVEVSSILKEITKTLNKIQNCLVVVSLGFPTQYDIFLSEFFSRTIEIKNNHGSLSVLLDDNGKKTSLLLRPDELELSSQYIR